MFHNFGQHVNSSFVHHYRCFSLQTVMPEKLHLNYGGKIFLPPSALVKLSSMSIQLPMQFKISSTKNKHTTHTGVLEFIAEEGRCYLPHWTLATLGLVDGDLIVVTSATLPLGKFVKIQPQHVDFLQITDPKAVLENAFRSFSTLTEGDIISIQYNDKQYSILVIETKPKTPGISIIETDLQVDFAAPLGYVEPERVPKAHASFRSLEGTTDSVKAHTASDGDLQFKAFAGSGKKLNGKENLATSSNDEREAASLESSTAALRLPPGMIFLGYKVKPVSGTAEAKDTEVTSETFKGSGKTLRSVRKKANGSNPSVDK